MGRRHDDERERLLAFQTLLDGSRTALEQRVELNTLRKLCARGIPEYPTQLRPLAYALLLGTLPPDKRAWKRSAKAQRLSYYQLVRTFMDELETAPPPTDPASRVDVLAARLSSDLDRVERGNSLLSSRTSPSPSSPLAPPRDENQQLVASSSSSDEGGSDEAKERRAHAPRQRQRIPPLTSRRALFVRVDHIHEASRTSSRKGKQRESVNGASDSNGDLLSPKIILSPDADGTRSGNTLSSEFAQAISNSTAPSLSLSIPGEPSSGQPPSPITLLSPQNLHGPRISSALFQPDTHGEALRRLLYVFCRANPHLPYTSTFVDVLVPLYLVFAEASGTSQGRAQYAEEETYWAFKALMAEFGPLVSATVGDDSTVTTALRRLGRHMRWADEPLWNILCSRNLDPSLPLYTFQWITGLWTHDKQNLMPIWDHLFSQPPPSSESAPRLEALINLGVAVICMLKRNIMYPPPRTPSKRSGDMWHGAADMDAFPTTVEEEDPDETFVRCLQLFRNYQLDQLGGAPALLYTAFELKQELQAAAVNGTDPDAPGWSESRDAASAQSGWGSWKLKQAAADSGKNTWSRYSESDAAASLAKAGSNFTASAMAKWSSAPAVPSWKTVGAAAGKWWKTSPKDDQSFDGSDYDPYGSLPSTPGRSPQVNRFTSPEKPSSQSSNELDVRQRERSDSGASASGLSVSSLQGRLSGLALSLGHGTPKQAPSPRTASGPRPLLLSSRVRRASSSSSTRPRAGSPSPRSSQGLHTPPPSTSDNGGLYRIRSHGRPSPIKRSSLADSAASSSKRDTIDSVTTQYTALTFGSDTDSRRESTSTPSDSDASAAALRPVHSAPAGVHEHATPKVVPVEVQPSPLPSLTINTAPAVSPSHSLATLQPEPPSPAEVISIPTPKTSHLTEDDYDHVYEPAEDSFILLDALEEDALVLRAARPALCVEIGSGSGICSTFITSVLGVTDTCVLSTDINQHAANATQRTGEANGAPLNPILCNLLDPLLFRLYGKIDLLVFNPPYVETEEAEMTATQQQRDIGGAWAGGNFGMTVTNLVLNRLPALLSPGGRFYLVAIEQNKPKEIVARMRATGLECKVVMKRRAGRELLSVIRMSRPEDLHVPPPTAHHSFPTPVTPSDDYGALLEAYS